MVLSVLLPSLSHLLLLLLLLLFSFLLLDPQQVSARAGSALWERGPCGGPAIWVPLASPSCRSRAGAFDLASEVGKEASIQIPCQLVWLISSRAHSNKNQHLHNTWGHLGSTLLPVKDYVPASDAPVPGRGASACQAEWKSLLLFLGWWLIPQWGIWVGLYLG